MVYLFGVYALRRVGEIGRKECRFFIAPVAGPVVKAEAQDLKVLGSIPMTAQIFSVTICSIDVVAG